VAEAAERFSFPLVVDPVMVSKHGARLMDEDACRVLAERLIPRAFLLMPNLEEATMLAGFAVDDPISMLRAAKQLASLGAANVLVKGGHLRGDALDILYTRDEGVREFCAPRIDTPHTHGSGCTYSAAITAGLALGSHHRRHRPRQGLVTAAIRLTGAISLGPQSPRLRFCVKIATR
jgi:hydroxymethylpyrimidine/phosphomethylpyrimidine kinase